MGDPHGRKWERLRKLFTRKRKLASGLPSETPSQSTSLPLHPSPAADNPPKTLASVVARPIDPDPSPKSTPSIPTNCKPEDLWDRAEEELSNDKGKAEILEAYQEILKSQLGSELAAKGTASRHEQMSRLLNTKVEELERRKWRFHLGDHNIEVETLFSGVVRNILLAKDIISSAALADPHAALACAGVSVILTVSLAEF
jgi:N-terminal domain of NWD NACHT-NTPase